MYTVSYHDPFTSSAVCVPAANSYQGSSLSGTYLLMDAWLEIIVRQLILYSLPVLVSLTCISMVEACLLKKTIPHPFYAISWRGTWFPLLASLAFHRGIIIALPNTMENNIKLTALRFATHVALCLLGFLLYTWSLTQQAPAGLPPVHHWWAKVLMFFNLCMACLHLLPLPGLLAGQALAATKSARFICTYLNAHHGVLVLSLLAASPLLDLILGNSIVFPIYESLSSLARNFSS